MKKPYYKSKVASSALSVCAETMDHSTGTEPKLFKLFVI